MDIFRHCEEPAGPNVAEECDPICPVEEDIPAVPTQWESPKHDEKAVLPTPPKQVSIGDGSTINDELREAHDWACDPIHPVVEDIPTVAAPPERPKHDENAIVPTSPEQANIEEDSTIKDELVPVHYLACDPPHPVAEDIPEVPAQLVKPKNENAAVSMSAKQPITGGDITVKDEPMVVKYEELKTGPTDKPHIDTEDVPMPRTVKKPAKDYPICCIETLQNVGSFPARMRVKRRPNDRSVKPKPPSAYPRCSLETLLEDRA